jgi:hypothetical protein
VLKIEKNECMNCCLRRFCPSAIWDFIVNDDFDNNFESIIIGIDDNAKD